jgi:cytochrome c peroxidase
MDLPWDLAQARLNAHPVYAELFAEVFGPGAIDSVKVVKALAQFERTFLSFGSKYDKVQRGEAQYTDSERRGFALFMTEKGDCFHCHGPPRFGDDVFRNNGLDTLDPAARTGRSEVTGRVGDAAKWKTPTLRNVAASAPYMHDGRFATLEEVMDHYDKGIIPGPTVDPLLLGHRARSGELLLTEQDKVDLISFLNCLTDSAFLGNPEFGPP